MDYGICGVLLTYIIEYALVFLSVVREKTKYKYICTRNSNEIDKNPFMNFFISVKKRRLK